MIFRILCWLGLHRWEPETGDNSAHEDPWDGTVTVWCKCAHCTQTTPVTVVK